MTSASVTKTAHDALMAKLSAVAAGYNPVITHGDTYRELLHRISDELDRISEKRQKNSDTGGKGFSAKKKKKEKSKDPHSHTMSVQKGKEGADIDGDDDDDDDDHGGLIASTTSSTVSSSQSQKRKHKQRGGSIAKRQTPLVNAGYAARVASVACVVENFIRSHGDSAPGRVRGDYHDDGQNPRENEGEKLSSALPCDDSLSNETHRQTASSNNESHPLTSDDNNHGVINVVLLGCGFDVLGLWSHTLCPDSIRVYELDCGENCRIKQEALIHSGLLHPSSPSIHTSDQCGNDDDNDSIHAKEKNGEITSVIASGWIGVSSSLHDSQEENQTTTTTDVSNMSNANSDDFDVNTDNNEPRASHHGDKNGNIPNYTLLSADLRDVRSVQRSLFSDALVDIAHPTVVISELVLAYLGQVGADSLLEFIATEVCISKHSLLVAYEPIGSSDGGSHHINIPCSSLSTATILSVVGGYVNTYCQQFTSKLNKGCHIQQSDKDGSKKHVDNKQRLSTDSSDNHSNGNPKEQNCQLLHPLGINCDMIRNRFIQNGFGVTTCCSAGVTASWASRAATNNNNNNNKKKTKKEGSTGLFNAPELFNEHAALALHLSSYVLICAFSSKTDSDCVRNIARPSWSTTLSNGTRKTLCTGKTSSVDGDTIVGISPIRMNDQERVRIIFKQSYEHLFEEFPAVRKMVKTALKNDLSGKYSSQITMRQEGYERTRNEDYYFSQKRRSNSAILERYNSWGGTFFVAAIVEEDEDEVEKDDHSQFTTAGDRNGKMRKIVGCVGIRKFTPSECKARRSGTNAFEIRRLAIDGDFRGKGLGKALLTAVEEFTAGKVVPSGASYKLVATTPSLLMGANHLYLSAGFALRDEVAVGNMLMRTYVKDVNKIPRF